MPLLNAKCKNQRIFIFFLAPSRGKLYKGNPFAYIKSSVEDKAKIQDLMVSLIIS